MITAITKQSGRVKKKEWSIYHNIGVQQDAERFSLIDSVLDGELNDDFKAIQKTNTVSKPGVLARAGKRLRKQFSHSFFRTYLFCWFSLYFGASVIVKLVR